MIDWLRKLISKPERKYDTLDLFREIYGSNSSTSTGQSINWHRALQVTTVLACARVRAEGLAQVPWKIHQMVAGSSTIADKHYLHPLVRRRPNPRQTSFGFRETLGFHLAIRNNAYVWLGRVGIAREIRQMVPLQPQFVERRKRANGEYYYHYAPPEGGHVDFPEDAIWHIRGASWDGQNGYDPIAYAREAIGLAIALETSHGNLHRGVHTSGAYAIDGKLTPEKYAELSAWLDKYALGGDRAGKPLILDMGAKWLNQQMTGVDAQHIETRGFQVNEICRAMRVMPIMIGHYDKSVSYTSAEQMFIAHKVHTLDPDYQRFIESADQNLLTDAEFEEGYYFKLHANALLRGSATDRSAFYQNALGGARPETAWLTRNEVRDLEEFPRIDDPQFDALPKPTTEVTP